MNELTIALSVGAALLLGLAIGAWLGSATSRSARQANARLEEELAAARREAHEALDHTHQGRIQVARLEEALESRAKDLARLENSEAEMKRAVADQQQRIELLQRKEEALNERLAAQEETEARLRTDHRGLTAQAHEANEKLAEFRERLADATANLKAEREAHTATKRFIEDASAQLKSSFVEAASSVFDQKAIALDEKIRVSGEAAKSGIETTLKPFAETVGTLQQRLEQLSKESAQERAQLVGSLGELKTLNQHMAEATEGLTKALKGNAKARGDWGELLLETVLKASGLQEGTNYVRQEHTRDEEGRGLRPDVIVLLPDGRKVVIDSKVNMVAYSDMVNATTPKEQDDALLRHTADMRAHMRDLANKNYPAAVGADALELTVMFVPIEGALSAALGVNHDLQIEAFSRNIVFASPNTLMALLRVVERHWVRDRLQRQVTLVGEQATKLLDSVIHFLDEFDKIGERIDAANSAWQKASNRLRDSKQSVVARTRRLIEAGAKASKALPDELQVDIEAPALLFGSEPSSLVD